MPGVVKSITANRGLVTAATGGLVALADMANLSASVLIGREASGAGVPQAITIGSGLTLTGTTLSAAAGYTDEQAQDAVGTILADSGTIDFTYDDATPSITAVVKDDSITYAKLQNVSATDRLLGRATAGAGDVEEIACTSFARSILDDADAAAARATLGAGTGTVTSFTFNDGNGFDGTVTSSTTTPTLDIKCTVTGLLKGNGTAISAATANTDYTDPSGLAAYAQPLDAQLTSLAGLSYSGNALKAVRVNAAESAFELATVTPPAVAPGLRLSLSDTEAVSTGDLTTSTVYYVPHVSGGITLHDGSDWTSYTVEAFGWFSTASLTASKVYDVFARTATATPSSTDTGTDVLTFSADPDWHDGTLVYPSATQGGLTANTAYWFRRVSSTTGTLHSTLGGAIANTGVVNLTASITAPLRAFALDMLAWTDDATRATALARINGRLCKTGDAARLYVGTLRTNAGSNVVDTAAARLLWNMFNRAARRLKVVDVTNSWAYATASFRAWNNNTANSVEYVAGLDEAPVAAHFTFCCFSSSGNAGIGIGVDSSTVNSADAWGQSNAANQVQQVHARYCGHPGIGRHTIYALEKGAAGATIYGDNGGANQGGLTAEVWG